MPNQDRLAALERVIQTAAAATLSYFEQREVDHDTDMLRLNDALEALSSTSQSKRLAALDCENDLIAENLVDILERHKINPQAVWPEITEIIKMQADRIRDLEEALSSTAQSAPCPECVEFARLFSTVNVAAMKDEGATAEEMRRSLVECRGAVVAAAKVWDKVKVKVSGQPVPVQGVVVPSSKIDELLMRIRAMRRVALTNPDAPQVTVDVNYIDALLGMVFALRQGGG